MTPIFPDRHLRPDPGGAGFESLEQRYREVFQGGREIAIESGKRAEFEVERGARAMLYVAEGGVRVEADDTQAAAGDILWFQPSPASDGRIGLQADGPFRGVLAIRAEG